MGAFGMGLRGADREADGISAARLVRVGTVTDVYPGRATARVRFEDEGAYVTAELQVLQRNVMKNRDYAMPDVGERVLCLFLAGASEDGFIIGGVYAVGDQIPSDSTDVRTVRFGDGSTVTYDRAAKKLDVNAKGDVTVTAAGKVDVTAGTSLSLRAGGSIEIKAGGAVSVTGASVKLGG